MATVTKSDPTAQRAGECTRAGKHPRPAMCIGLMADPVAQVAAPALTAITPNELAVQSAYAAQVATITRLFNVAIGFASTVLVLRYLRLEEQGLYYGMSSLAAIQVFADLGVSYNLVRRVSALGSRGAEGLVQIAEEFARTRAWFRVAGVLLPILAFTLGSLTFSRTTLPRQEWMGPWALASIGLGCNLIPQARLALAEGLGLVRSVYVARALQMITAALVSWTVLVLGGGLWAQGAFMAAPCVVTLSWSLSPKVRRVLAQIRELAPTGIAVLPRGVPRGSQRLSLSWLCGLPVANGVVPITIFVAGAEVAGVIGVGLAVASNLGGAAVGIVTSRAALLGRLFVIDRGLMRSHFEQAHGRSAALYAAVAAAAVAAVSIASHLGFESRLPSVTTIALLLVGIGFYMDVQARSVLLRAMADDPYLPVSLFAAAVVPAAVAIGASVGSQEMIGTTLAVAHLFVWLIAMRIFRRTAKGALDDSGQISRTPSDIGAAPSPKTRDAYLKRDGGSP